MKNVILARSLLQVLTVILQQIQRQRGVKTSGVPFCFWMFMAFCEAIPLYSHISRQVSTICLFVCLGFYVVSTIFQLFNGDSSQIHVSWTISFTCT